MCSFLILSFLVSPMKTLACSALPPQAHPNTSSFTFSASWTFLLLPFITLILQSMPPPLQVVPALATGHNVIFQTSQYTKTPTCHSYCTRHHCLTVLIHVLHKPQIFFCHSRLLHAVPQLLSWNTIVRYLSIDKNTVQLFLAFCGFLHQYFQSKHLQCSFSEWSHAAAHGSLLFLT